jgi:hypothetical protein
MTDKPSGYDHPKAESKSRIDGKLPPGKVPPRDEVIQIRLTVPPWLRGLHKSAALPWGILALVLVAAAAFFLWQGPASSGSTAPVATTLPSGPAPAVTDAGYAAWKAAVSNPSSWTAPSNAVTSALPAPSWWARTFSLPPRNAMLAEFQQGLPLGTKVVSFEPIGWQEVPGGIAVDYEAKLQLPGALYSVPILPVPVPSMATGPFAGLEKNLVVSTNLPAGWYYDTQAKQLLMSPSSVYPVKFQVLKAAKVNGTWQVLESVPLPFERSPVLEKRLLAEYPNGGARVVRAEGELQQEAQTFQQAMQQFDSRVVTIKSDIAANSDRLMKSLPPYPSKPRYDNGKFGGSGSGEPTRTAGRTLGGAAVGAGLGAAFGQSGEAAGIGAGAGLLAGLVYDGVSKSNDKKKFEQQQAQYNASVRADYNQAVAAYNAAKKQAQQQADAYAQEQIGVFVNELQQQAGQRQQLLQQG